MSRVVDIDALTIGGLEALANERGMRLITKEAYEALRAGRAVQDDGLDFDALDLAIRNAYDAYGTAGVIREYARLRALPPLHDPEPEADDAQAK